MIYTHRYIIDYSATLINTDLWSPITGLKESKQKSSCFLLLFAFKKTFPIWMDHLFANCTLMTQCFYSPLYCWWIHYSTKIVYTLSLSIRIKPRKHFHKFTCTLTRSCRITATVHLFCINEKNELGGKRKKLWRFLP